ncbi:MAG: cation diffusion facilitator family transporter [Candidatus Caccosoma sp.]|nr:cation diffusion facilitator family transporter [Candidatus Caccosoma sp.]
MIKFLVKKFIKNYDDVENELVREKYGVLGGVLGIICNLLLFIIKLVIGLLVNAIAIVSDAFNNLSDSFSSIVSVISAKLSNKKPDKEHPFGHGRIEYVSTLIVAMIIVIVGFELFITSAKKILIGIHLIDGIIDTLATGPSLIISIIILVLSLFVKLWMYYYNKYLGNKINSSILKATAADSISDVLTSLAIIFATIIGGLLLKDNYFYLDGGIGIVIAIIICINGFKIAINTISDLLGKPASKEDIEKIKNIVLAKKEIIGIHDLMVHNYGAGRKFASVHAEVNSNSNFMEIHEIIDELEQKCYEKTHIELVIHLDPIDLDSKEVQEANKVIANVIEKYSGVSYHDLRITNGKENINVIFDIIFPFNYKMDEIKYILDEIKKDVKKINSKYTLVIRIDRPFDS